MFGPGLWEWIYEILIDSDVYFSGGQFIYLPLSKCGLYCLSIFVSLFARLVHLALYSPNKRLLVGCCYLQGNTECKARSCLTELSLVRGKRHKRACEEEWGLLSRKRVLQRFVFSLGSILTSSPARLKSFSSCKIQLMSLS